MADIKISELTEYTGALPADSFAPIVVNGATKKFDASLIAPLESPAFSGTPTAPTPSAGNNSTQIATTAFVQSYATPSGSIAMWPGASAPSGWLLCQGQAVSRTIYASIFTAIGEAWGVGDGSTTFNLPDMRESAPVGVGTYSAVTGTTHGTITAHDAFTLGQSKDDQVQPFSLSATSPFIGPYNGTNNDVTAGAQGSFSSISFSGVSELGSYGTPRVGAVTRGKRIGLNFIIKV